MRGRATIAFIISLFATMPAWSEVCDKARPEWRPADGPVSEWSHTISGIDWVVLIFLIVLMIYSWKRCSLLLSFIALATAQCYVLYFVLMVFPSDTYLNVYYAAIQEGCMGIPLIPIIVFTIVNAAIIIACVGIFIRKRKLLQN